MKTIQKLRSPRFLKIALLFLILTAGLRTTAQTVNFTLLKQPCNHDGIVVATVSGMSGPYTFQWYGMGINQSDASVTVTTDTLKNYAGGNIYVEVTNAAKVYASNTTSASPFSYKVSTTNADCPVLGTASVNITGGVSPFTIQWYKGTIGNIVATGSPVSLGAGYNYGVQITDAAGCVFGSAEQNDSLYIYDSNAPVVTLTSTPANCSNGTVSISSITGAVAPDTYVWSNGSTANGLSNLIMGNYSVVVTDSRGCVGTGYTSVTQAVTVNANVVPTNATCVQSNGSAITFGSGGGTPPYSYQYSNGQTTQSATNLTAGYYSVVVTDANGCIGQSYFEITATTPIAVTYSSSASSCTSPTGTANLLATGGTLPYTINWATSPAQTGSSAMNLSSGLYSFNITDAVGCAQNGAVYVPTVSGLFGYDYASNATCPGNDGMAGVVLTAGAPPYTYAWSTGASTAVISNLASSGYTCTVTDAMNCQVFKYPYVGENSTISLGFSMTPSSCIFNSDGSLAMSISGGVPPYTISWSNGETTATATALLTGYYSVGVTDSKGCSAFQDYIFVSYNAGNNSCYCTITGTVYDDANNNCVQDPGELGIQNIMITNNSTISNMARYTFTDDSGKYTMIVPSGTYNVQEITNNLYPLSPCQSNTNPVIATASSGCVFTVNFANVINPLHDIHIRTINMNQPVPGYTFSQRVVVKNNGTVTENAIIMSYADDGQLDYTGSSALALTQPNSVLYPNWYTISSGFPTLASTQYVSTDISYNVPANIPLGTTVNFFDTTAYTTPMSNWLNDYSPWNNLNQKTTTVVGSFDPNFLEVTPQGSGAPGYIASKDSVLDYDIHFQNTGTAQAQKVVVKVQLDPNLNMQTLEPGYATAPYTTNMDQNGNVSFTFSNINLADSSSNPITSIGIVSYSIHVKKNVPGTQYKTQANIYFDYNAPVPTNTTLNTIESPEGISENKTAANSLSLYPNPANDAFTIKIISTTESSSNAEGLSNAGKIGMYTIDGKLLLEQNVSLTKGLNLFSISSADLPIGLYFIRVTSNSGQQVAKVSIAR